MSVDSDETIIDVRDPEKYEAGHAAGAINLPHTQIMAGQDPDLAKDAPIRLYCSTGNKAARMARELRRRGFTRVESTSLDQLTQGETS